MKKILILLALVFLLPFINAVFINTSTLNTSSSATSIETGLGINLDRLQIEINAIEFHNLSYTNAEIETEVTQLMNFSDSNSNINSLAFPFLSFSNVTDKNVSTNITFTTNVTVTVDVTNCNIANITYESNSGSFTELFDNSNRGLWFCNSGNNRLRVNITGLETNENTLQINYEDISIRNESRWIFFNESDGEIKFSVGKTTGNIFGIGDVNFDISTFFLNAITNRIGIGTTNPDSALTVVGAINATQYKINGSVGFTGSCTNMNIVGGIVVSCND